MRVAFAAALLASACQRDSNAEFDDERLPSSVAGATSAAAGTSPDPGASGADDGGTSSQPAAGAGGKPSAGGAGGTTGDAGKPSMAGKGGQAAGGTGSGGGGTGGSEQAGMAGSGGKPSPDPDPVTLKVTEFEDTTIASCEPNENRSQEATLQTDGDFCRFESLLRPIPPEIPVGAEVTEATLSLYCVNAGGGGMVTVSFATGTWKASTVRYNNERPKQGEVIGTVTCAKVGDVVTLDMTSTITAWLGGKVEPNGVYLTTAATDGTDFGSSEAEKPEHRPALSVTYQPAVK